MAGVQHFGIGVQEWSWWLSLLLELWKSQHFTPWRSLSSNTAWYREQWRCPPVHTWLTVGHLDTWHPRIPNSKFLIPDGTLGSVQLLMLKPFWYQLSLSAHYLSTSASRDKDVEKFGELQKKGLLLEGKLISSVWCRVRAWYWNYFKTSHPWSRLILLGTWWCSDGLVYRVRSFEKGLSEVCDDASASCLFLPELFLHL